MQEPFKHRFRGVEFIVRYARFRSKKSSKKGDCDSPFTKGPVMRISGGLSDLDEMETIIHEGLHACIWDLDEEAVAETAKDIAACLAKCNYGRGT